MKKIKRISEFQVEKIDLNKVKGGNVFLPGGYGTVTEFLGNTDGSPTVNDHDGDWEDEGTCVMSDWSE